MFANDRDLLVLEPNLFRDAAWAGQRLMRGVGSVSGTTLTLASHDVNFEEAAIEAGQVVAVDGAAYEIIARLSATALTISRLRASQADPPLPPAPAANKPVEIVTFRPQIALVHAQVLRMLGIEPDDVPQPCRITEDEITNPGALTLVESLGAIYQVYVASAGVAAVPENPAYQRARVYLDRFEEARQRAWVQIDLDGDGLPDSTRRLNVKQLIRA